MEKFGVVIITTSGDLRFDTLSDRELSIDYLRNMVDGHIEVVQCTALYGTIFEDLRMIVDENGLYKDKPVNVLASALYSGHVIVGDVVLTVFDDFPVADVYAIDFKTCSRLFSWLSKVRSDILENSGKLAE